MIHDTVEPRDLVVPRRFRGPSSSGNGGWTAGAIAGLLAGLPERLAGGHCPDNHADPWPPVEVTLRSPPPLDTSLQVALSGVADLGVVARCGEHVVAEARVHGTTPADVPWVPVEAAEAASRGYRGLRSHPFPECFVCGPARGRGDGLRIFPGPVPGTIGPERPGGLVAAPWTPDPSTREDFHAYAGTGGSQRASLPVTWAALDCVSGWSSDLEHRPMVLGRITAQVYALPAIGEPHVVVGVTASTEGRRTFTRSALFDATGRALARASQVWFAVEPAAFERQRDAGPNVGARKGGG